MHGDADVVDAHAATLRGVRAGAERPRLRRRSILFGVETVIVDAENVRRSLWPNIAPTELVELCRAWAEREGAHALVVFDGSAPVEADDVVGTGAETADDWIARHAAEHDPYWLVTSDRALRARAGGGAVRIVGGGTFARDLTR